MRMPILCDFCETLLGRVRLGKKSQSKIVYLVRGFF